MGQTKWLGLCPECGRMTAEYTETTLRGDGKEMSARERVQCTMPDCLYDSKLSPVRSGH